MQEVTTKVDKATITAELKHHIRDRIKETPGLSFLFRIFLRHAFSRKLPFEASFPGLDFTGHLAEAPCNSFQLHVPHFIEAVIIFALGNTVDSLLQD